MRRHRSKKASARGRRYALCVGINNYPGTGSDLNGCVNDARDWKAALEKRGYSVSLLLDGEATYSRMARGIRQLVASGKSGDTLVFTYSGHGSWLPDQDGDEADGRDEMLCPHDVDSGAYLMDDELAEVFGRKKEGVRLYFISDSCHSGTVARFMGAAPGSGAVVQPRFLHPEVFVKDKATRKAIKVVSRIAVPGRQKYPALLAAGCRDTEYSYDAYFDGRYNGAFTYHALRALAKSARTPAVWMGEIRKSLPSHQHPQSPSLYGSRQAKSGPMF